MHFCPIWDKNYSSNQFANWLQQYAAGILHLKYSNLLFVNTIPKRRPPKMVVFFLVDSRRFELPTPAMRMRCAPSCATSPFTQEIILLPFMLVKDRERKKAAGFQEETCCYIYCFRKVMLPVSASIASTMARDSRW